MKEVHEDNLFAFVLGRERELAKAEVEAVLNRFGVCFSIISLSGNILFLKLGPGSAEGLTDILGGTIKIFRIIPSHKDDGLTDDGRRIEQGMDGGLNGERIASIISEYKAGYESKLNFGISSYSKIWGVQKIFNTGLSVKKLLKEKGFHSRLVVSREGTELSSIMSLKNDLVDKGIEIGIFDLPLNYCSNEMRTKNFSPDISGSKNMALGVLVGLNNPEEWSHRDYDKPAGDKYSGMVPPKLARMLVNITLALLNPKDEIRNSKQTENNNKKCSKDISGFEIRNSSFHDCVVADPFCGSGNILMEALMLGCDVVGSDISEKAVADTKANLEWLGSEYQKSRIKDQKYIPKTEIFKADATSENFGDLLSSKLSGLSSSVTIVTEPYLGEPKKFKPSYNAARGEYNKVKEIYIKFFENLKEFVVKQVSSKASKLIICIVFPLIETSDRGLFSLYKECVDEIEKIGYTELRPPLIYGREYQVVKREIAFFSPKKGQPACGRQANKPTTNNER